LLQPAAAAERGDLDIETFGMKEALANADIEQRKRKCLRYGLADPQLVLGAARGDDREAQDKRHNARNEAR